VSGRINVYQNITMQAPNGSLYNCGVSNTKVFTCN